MENKLTDLLWEEAQKLVQKQPHIRMFFFIGRILDTSQYTGDMLDLHTAGKAALKNRMMKGFPEVILDIPGAFTITEEPERSIAIEGMTKQYEESVQKKIAHYKKWILSQGLVAACTILDTFLEEYFETILSTKIEPIPTTGVETEIAIAKENAEKEVHSFAFSKIEKRVNKIETRLGISKQNIFNMSKYIEASTDQLKRWTLKYLIAIYKKRHRYVHQDEVLLNSYEELSDILLFFRNLIGMLSGLARTELQMLLDVNLTIQISQMYKALKVSKEKKKSP